MSGAGARAQPITAEETTAYLARDPVGNVELLCALRYDDALHCFGAMRDGSLAGVLVATRQEGDDALTARFAAADDAALTALIAACPRGVRRIVVCQPWMLPALKAAFRLIPERRSERLFVAPLNLTVVPSPAVRPLTLADMPLVAASATQFGADGLADTIGRGFRVFGIVAGNRLVAHAIAANTTDWTEEVMSVWTAPRHRGQGLATQVVATVTADILSRGRTATYVTAVSNRASQRVAQKIGFQPAYDIAGYLRLW